MELTDVAGFSGESWPQYQDEIGAFVDLLKTEGVRSYLEVGCRYGDTLHAVGCALPEGATVVGIDWGRSFVHPQGECKRREPSEFKRERLNRCIADLNAKGRKASIVVGDSRETGVRQLAALRGPYDAIFIDADHSRIGVETDWLNYGGMGRIVAFHDVCSDGRRLTGPGDLFRRLSETHRHKVLSVDPMRRGIGVLWRE